MDYEYKKHKSNNNQQICILLHQGFRFCSRLSVHIQTKIHSHLKQSKAQHTNLQTLVAKKTMIWLTSEADHLTILPFQTMDA